MGGLASIVEVVRVMNLPCREHSVLISRDQDGQIRRATHIGLRLHFVLCAPCRHLAAQLRFLRRAAERIGVVRAERALGDAAMPADVRERIRRRISG